MAAHLVPLVEGCSKNVADGCSKALLRLDGVLSLAVAVQVAAVDPAAGGHVCSHSGGSLLLVVVENFIAIHQQRWITRVRAGSVVKRVPSWSSWSVWLLMSGSVYKHTNDYGRACIL